MRQYCDATFIYPFLHEYGKGRRKLSDSSFSTQRNIVTHFSKIFLRGFAKTRYTNESTLIHLFWCQTMKHDMIHLQRYSVQVMNSEGWKDLVKEHPTLLAEVFKALATQQTPPVVLAAPPKKRIKHCPYWETLWRSLCWTFCLRQFRLNFAYLCTIFVPACDTVPPLESWKSPFCMRLPIFLSQPSRLFSDRLAPRS